MAAPKAKRSSQTTAKATPPRAAQAVPPASVPPLTQTVNGKKKKKKKGKGKGVAVAELDDEDEDDDGMPPLEPLNGSLHSQARSASRTGLSPELESVHLSTTASLSASARRHNHPAAIAEAELLATADHLARSMEADPEGVVNDEYWAAFPDHLRNFVRNTYSQLSSPGNEDEKTQAMYAIAQQIHSGVGVNFNTSTNAKGHTTTRYASYPTSMPFDPSIFSDPAFTLAMEQAAAANGLHPSSDRGHMPPANVVLLNEYGSEEHEYAEDEYYSDEDVEDLDDDLDDHHPRSAKFTMSYKEGSVNSPDFAEPQYSSNGTPTKKKNKKKKRKGNGTPQGPEAPSDVAPMPATPGSLGPSPVTNLTPPVSAPNNRMPAPRPPPTANPPPSSRAAGKQPMSYTAAAPAPNNPPPSRRAASKAPITSHAYPHNHAHHHPSPPSSNASAPHKPRPPANGSAPKSQQNNSKIWSTSTTEERERIKEFWLGLGEEERRSLVKIEKEAVLKKMKEQQKHSCMCAVCGRKRFVVFVLPFKIFSLTLVGRIAFLKTSNQRTLQRHCVYKQNWLQIWMR
ncbi:salt tolerance down-regulator-domain-containing protein [Abortiporus biennis]|nr:salt tolerance down-regulator-domain-containing protein [Abortiporus biennis]